MTSRRVPRPASLPILPGRDLYSLESMTRECLMDLVRLAVGFKRGELIGSVGRPGLRKAAALLFFDPSLRTRASCELALSSLDVTPVTLDVGSTSWRLEWRDGAVMDGDAAEHVREAAGVLGRYGSALAVRAFPPMNNWADDRQDLALKAFVRHSPVPVVNMESAIWHPLQGLADVMTLSERSPGLDPAGRKVVVTWAPHPRPLPTSVANTAVHAFCLAGCEVVLAHPEGYDLDPEVTDIARAASAVSGGSLEVTHDREAALSGASVIYAKSWGSLKPDAYGDAAVASQRARDHAAWEVTEETLARAGSEAVFMHCLPVRRNVVVSDGVLDGRGAVVLDQAENRLHTAKAIFAALLGARLSDAGS